MRRRETRQINDVGIGLKGLPGERMRDILVYPENGSVLVRVETGGRELLQYLTPEQAAEFALAFLQSGLVARDGKA